MRRLFAFLIIICTAIIIICSTNNSISSEILALGYDEVNIDRSNDCEIIEIVDKIDYRRIINELNIEISNIDEVSDRIIIEGYTNKVNNYILINNKKINIQMSVSSDKIIIGSPLIYNSF